MSTTIIKECPRHGKTEHVLLNDGSWKCKECRKDAVIDIRRRNKIKLVKYKGGKCEICGYNKCIGALEFHHLNPTEKDFGLSCGNTKSLEKLKAEADKCIMVCANCHREIHENERDKEIIERDTKKIEMEQKFFLSKKNSEHKKSKKLVTSNLNVESIKKDISNKTPKKEIAAKYSVGLTTLKRFLAKNGIVYDETPKSKLQNLTKNEFINSFIELGSFTSVGKKYDVSDKAIQKWCVKNNLPCKKKDLIDYIKDLSSSEDDLLSRQ